MDVVSTAPVTAAGLFVGTNIDDIVVLGVLAVSSRTDGRPRMWQIWAGQYLGFATLVIISLLAAWGLMLVPGGWIWITGLVPLGLGLRQLITTVRDRNVDEPTPAATATGLSGVIGLTIANGGDNIAAYTPVFRTSGATDLTVTMLVFALGVAVWCLASTWLVSGRATTRILQTWGQWIVPLVFILIGLAIFAKAGFLGQ